MGRGEGVRSVIPVEETIIDPLYEPLKLNRYPLCPHLQRLKDVSHLRYGLSPYLLFDVEGMREVVEVILENPKLGDELKNNYEEFLKLYDEIFEYFRKYLKWFLGKENEELYVFAGELKIYGGKNKRFKILRHKHEEIFKKLNGDREGKKGIKDRYREILKGFLYTSNRFNEENYKKIAHLFRLEYPVKVKCPLCEEEKEIDPAIKPWMFMCEEGKIYSMKEALLRTFEFRRARWLYQSGMLHLFHKASTHTRLSHQIGCLIVAVNSLREIDVYPAGDFKMTLGEYLLMRGELHEFLMANLLHDLGHPPLSHVLEVNPFIELEHEEITRNLILGKKTKKEEEMDWYVTERYLLKMKAIKDFEHSFLENRYDCIYEIDVEKEVGEELDEDKLRGYFLEYLDKNNEILESEIVTVSEVLDNFGVDKERVVKILTGKVFCPKCQKLVEMEIEIIENNKVKYRVKCPKCGEVDIKPERIYDTQFLNKLVDSEIDFDRIDHVKRDSDICGLSLTSFRLLELLGSISIVLPGSNARKDVYEAEENKPYIFVSEDGLKYVMDLLNTRRLIFNEVLYSDEKVSSGCVLYKY